MIKIKIKIKALKPLGRELVTLGFIIFLMSALAQAGSPFLIIEFDADEVEVRDGNQYNYLSIDELGSLPIEILEQDTKQFLKIKTKKLGVIWVNQGDVKTNKQKKYTKNCRSIAIAKKSDVRQYGARGAGEECK